MTTTKILHNRVGPGIGKTHLYLMGLLMLFGMGLAILLARSIVNGAWPIVFGLVILVPAVILLLRYPFGALMLWLLISLFLQTTPDGSTRMMYWMIHRAVPPLALGIVALSGLLKVRAVAGGWFIRGLHHWGASAMVVLVFLHMLRVIFYGAYKFPREITWLTGVMLLVVVIGFGFTGYLLPWDEKAFWATTVGTRIAGTPPLIGDWILVVVRGGEELSAVTLARFFGVHVWVLPTLLIILILTHLYLVIRLGIGSIPSREE